MYYGVHYLRYVLIFFSLVKGNIRTAVGQAQLLISQRFKQFTGLIDLSEVINTLSKRYALFRNGSGFYVGRAFNLGLLTHC